MQQSQTRNNAENRRLESDSLRCIQKILKIEDYQKYFLILMRLMLKNAD